MKIAVIGGHLSPALSVLDVIPSEWQVIFIGRKHTFEGDTGESLEYQTITRRNIPFFNLTTARLQRKVSKHTLPSLYKLPKGYIQALRILRREKPNVVIGFGGYLSVPVGYAAKTLGIPVVIHEQTFEAGLANKLLSRIADTICLSWESSQSFFPQEKVVVTGNPLKKYYKSDSESFFKDNSLPLLYVTGGSAGSHALNLLVEGMLPHILDSFSVFHQTGDAKEFQDYERLVQLRDALQPQYKGRYEVVKFVDPQKVGGLLQQAHIVLSRSGINTVTELLYFGKPAVLVPLPYGQKNEQLTNARFLEKQRMAVVCLQDETTSAELLQILDTMKMNYKTFQDAAERSKTLVTEHAAEKIVDVIRHVASKTITQERQTTSQ